MRMQRIALDAGNPAGPFQKPGEVPGCPYFSLAASIDPEPFTVLLTEAGEPP
jgi:hypothetical protein